MSSQKIPYLQRRAVVPLLKASGDSKKLIPKPEDVQGDVYWMFPKKFERFLFFIISGDRATFLKNLKAYLPSVTSGQQTIDNIKKIHDNSESDEKLDLVSSQIAFSKKGLNYLEKTDNIGDVHFDNGPMRQEKDALGDMSQWDTVFDKGNIHGVILVTAAVKDTCEKQTKKIRAFFNDSIKDSDIVIMEGRVRSGEGEHFGWRDGISQPGLKDLCVAQPGQRVVNPGVLIMGYPGDPVYDDKKLKALFGARIVGRFKKGAPLALTPLRDNTEYRKPDQINNFDYSTYFDSVNGTKVPYCPFAAHIRKTEPRNLEPIVSKDFLDRSVIIRAGIPYGEDITKDERKEWKKKSDEEKLKEYDNSPRGLLFVCYQSSIENGFYRQTTQFANNSFFPLTSLIPPNYGPDPIIGGPKPQIEVPGTSKISVPNGGEVTLQLMDSNNSKYEVTGVARRVNDSVDDTFTQEYFVTSRGGEWFFVPGIPVLNKWAQ